MIESWRKTGRFLIGRELFEALAIAGKVFDLEVELPQQVFREPIRFFSATDSLRALGGEFSTVLNRLCEVHNDQWCAVLVVTANSDDLPSGFRFDPPIESATLWSRLDYKPDGDVARSYSSVAESWIYFGSSGRWGCWADRDWELAVVGTQEALMLGSDRVPFQSVWQELQQMLSMSGGVLGDGESEAFFSNYA